MYGARLSALCHQSLTLPRTPKKASDNRNHEAAESMQQSLNSNDIEKGLAQSEYLDGYPSLAAFIASDPELAIYRSFDRLAARNLLYAQSELLYLEVKLDAFDKEDFDGDPRNRRLRASARSWDTLKKKDGRHDSERMECVMHLRAALKEYHEMLLLQTQILSLQRPHRRVFTALRTWFFRDGVPTVFDQGHLYSNVADLVALRPARDHDRLSRLLRRFGYFFKDKPNVPASWGGIRYFPERRITRVVKIIGTTVAAGLLVGAIAALHFVKPTNIRLGLVCVFTFLFAGSLALATNARQAEVFGASAAYAAVLVVFISGNLGQN